MNMKIWNSMTNEERENYWNECIKNYYNNK